MRIGIDARGAMKVTDGVGRYAIELLRAFSKRDDDNQYFVLKNPQTNFSFEYDHRFHELSVSLNRFSIEEQLFLPGILSRLKLDLFHSLHATLPLAHKGAKIVTVHDIFPIFLPWSFGGGTVRNKFTAVSFSALLRLCLKKATLVIADSVHTARDLSAHLDLDPGRVRQIYPGTDHLFPSKKPSPKSSDSPEIHAISKPYLITVTNFRPHKNMDKILEAFRLIRSRIPSFTLVVIGDDPKGRASRLGSLEEFEAQKVRLLGFVSDGMLANLLESSEAFLFPSLYEGFGFPILEAMARGTPVITSAIASLPEVAADAAVYVDPNNAEAIAQAVMNLHTNKKLKKDLQDRGRRQAKKFQWQHTAEKTLRVYDEAIGRSSSMHI